MAPVICFNFCSFFCCRNRNDLAEVVALLKTQIDPELLKREQEKAAEADEKKENTEGQEREREIKYYCIGPPTFTCHLICAF